MSPSLSLREIFIAAVAAVATVYSVVVTFYTIPAGEDRVEAVLVMGRLAWASLVVVAMAWPFVLMVRTRRAAADQVNALTPINPEQYLSTALLSYRESEGKLAMTIQVTGHVLGKTLEMVSYHGALGGVGGEGRWATIDCQSITNGPFYGNNHTVQLVCVLPQGKALAVSGTLQLELTIIAKFTGEQSISKLFKLYIPRS